MGQLDIIASPAGLRRRAMSLAAAAAIVGAAVLAAGAEAKTPGRTYCLLGRCHRVLTLAETRMRIGRTETVRASFYDDCARDRFNPCGLTSSGEVFRPAAPDNAASPIYPDGSMLLLFNPATGAAAVVRVNNAGPYHRARQLDVSVATAEALGFRTQGLADLELRVLQVPRGDEVSYRRSRRYWPVHGPIGRHGSIDAAHAALVRVAGPLPGIEGEPVRPGAATLAAIPREELPAAAEVADAVAMADAAAAEPISETIDGAMVVLMDAKAPEVVAAVVMVPETLPLGRVIELATAPESGRSSASGAGVTRGMAAVAPPRAGSGDRGGKAWPPAVARHADAVRAPAVEDAARGRPLASRFAPAVARLGAADDRAARRTGDPGLLAGLRARARRGVTPGRLPEISLDGVAAATGWLGRMVVEMAAGARRAARSGLATRIDGRGDASAAPAAHRRATAASGPDVSLR